MRLISQFSSEICRPLSHLINTCLSEGTYPKIWKKEIVTPVPKVHPPEKVKDLRRISGLMNFAKVTDKILAEYIIEDMEKTRDKAQYGNLKRVSIQHYIIKMLNKVLTSLEGEKNSKPFAVILEMIDWKQAFDRQSHQIGIKSFQKNGVRAGLFPILMSFFQNREMVVKWNGLFSKPRPLPGGGPQGDILGILEYLAQTNDNCEFVSLDEKYKFIDDLSLLEIVDLICAGLSSYDCMSHVPSDIGIDSAFLDANNIKSQLYLDNISSWTDSNQMELNASKSNYMIFNFSRNYKFQTRLYLNGSLLEQVEKKKLLGLILSDDLSWKSNTAETTKKAYKRMIILRNLFQFGVPIDDLIHIYILYIRSVLEQSAVVWHSSLTEGERLGLERVQKVALRLILKEDYLSYSHALEITGLPTLESRRTHLCLQFAKKCVQSEATKDMFPLNEHNRSTRNPEKYHVPFARTDRLKNSAIPYMARLLNAEHQS